MKVTVEIDATAEELREFFGLPNVKPLQQEMITRIQDSMQQGAAGFDPLSVMKPLFPAQMQSLEMLQKAFWDAFNQAGQTAGAAAPDQTDHSPTAKAKSKADSKKT